RGACEAGLSRAQSSAGPGIRARLDLLGCLGEVDQASGRYEALFLDVRRMLEEGLRLYGPRHPDVLWTLQNLGIHYSRVGRLRDSLILRLTAHEIVVENAGEESMQAAKSWAGLASVWADLGDKAKARSAIDRATAIAQHAPDSTTLDDVLQ